MPPAVTWALSIPRGSVNSTSKDLTASTTFSSSQSSREDTLRCALMPAFWVNTLPKRLCRIPVSSSSALRFLPRRRFSSSSSTSAEQSGKKSKRQVHTPPPWHTSREISKITGPDKPYSVHCSSPMLSAVAILLCNICARQLLRTPFKEAVPFQLHFTCTSAGRSFVALCPRLRSSL